jgi:hypothetical protein
MRISAGRIRVRQRGQAANSRQEHSEPRRGQMRRALATVASLTGLAALCLSAAPAQASTVAYTAKAAASPAGKSHDFGKFSAAQYLACTGKVAILGEFSLNVTGLTTSFKNYAKKDHGKQFKASVGWSTTISATLGASGATTCTPNKALKKIAAKFTVDGVKITLSPDFELKVNAGSAISVTQTTSQSLAVSGKLGLGLPSATHNVTPGTPRVTSGGSGTFDALIGANADISAGVVDLDFGLMAGIHASAKTQPDADGLCVNGYPELEATGLIGVTFFTWHKDKQFLDHLWTIKSVDGTSTTFSNCT